MLKLDEGDRRERISELIDGMHAALLNVKQEWRNKGETDALRAFVGTLSFVAETLAAVLGEILPSVYKEVPKTRLIAIREQAGQLHREVNGLIKDLEDKDKAKAKRGSAN